jgi:glycosyltransferase involved in cell wall biosynthesis
MPTTRPHESLDQDRVIVLPEATALTARTSQRSTTRQPAGGDVPADPPSRRSGGAGDAAAGSDGTGQRARGWLGFDRSKPRKYITVVPRERTRINVVPRVASLAAPTEPPTLPVSLLVPSQRVPDLSPHLGGPRVLLCTEGTYPYVGGGVSTWCDILCKQMPDVDFTLFTVTGNPDVRAEYELPVNARKMIHVPLWGMQEPAEYPLSGLTCTDFLRRKRTTNERIVAARFVPYLRILMRAAGDEGIDVGTAGEALTEMWRYFQDFDWNKTWKAQATWDAFVQEVLRPYEDGRVEALRSERPTMADLTTSLRWTYNFLMPLVAPLPEVDLVHSTIASFAALPGVVAKIERGTPFLLTEHGVYARERYIAVSGADFPFYAKRYLLQLTALIARVCYRYADVVAPVANFNKRWELRYGARQDQIQTVYNGIDPQIFLPGPKPAELRDVPVAVAAARVFPLKDIETMIRSADVARRQLPDVRFLVYGSLDADRPYVDKCRALIEELDLTSTFIFGGFHSSPAQVYNAGDISVLSSISEGFPYTVLESMSCARPVAATDVGGVSEALAGYGLVVPPRDGAALGEAAVELLRDSERRLELGRRAREQVLARYRTTHSVDSYRTLYDQLVTGDYLIGRAESVAV